SVYQSTDRKGIAVFQFSWQKLIWPVLKCQGTQKPLDGIRSNGCKPRIGTRREWSAMLHRIAHLNPSRHTIEQEPSGLIFYDIKYRLIFFCIFLRSCKSDCQLSF